MWRHAVALLLLHVKFGLYGLNACFVETQEGLGQARLAMAQAGFFLPPERMRRSAVSRHVAWEILRFFLSYL